MENIKPTLEELHQENENLVKLLDTYKTIIDSSVDWELFMLPGGAFSYCSPSCKSISGYEANEFIENPDLFIEIIHPLDKDYVNQHLDEKKQNIDSSHDLVFRILCKDGQVKWIEHFCKRAYTEAGEFIGYRSSNRDISKRKEIEDKLKQTNELLHDERQIFTQGNAVVFKWRNSENWPVEYVSPNVESIFGFTPAEIQSPQFIYSNFILPEDLERVASEVERYSKPKVNSFEHEPYRVIAKNGKIHWVLDYTIILRNDNGEIINYLGYLVDITAQKVVEETLRENEERLKITLNSIGDGVITTDEIGLVTGMNPVAEKYCGWTIAEAKGKPLTEIFIIINSETRKPVDNPVKMVMNSGATVGLANHTVLISKYGTEYQIADSAAPIKNIEGDISGVVLVFSDVTEKYVAQKLLAENEIKYRSVFQNSPVGIFVLDENGIILEANEGISITTGYSIDELIGSNARQLVVPENAFMVDQNIERILSGELLEHEIISRRKDGSLCNLILKETAFPLPNGKPGILSILNDITKRKLAEKLLHESEEKYYELYTLMRLMSDTMSDLMWAKDLDNKYIFANEAICNVLLQAKDTKEPIGKDDLFFAKRERELHPEDLQWHTFGELCINSDAETLKQMKTMQFDEYGNVKGKFLYLDVHKAPLITKEGKLIGVVGSGRDITQQKIAETVIVESEERLKTLINATPDIICFKDGQGRWLIANDSDLELFCLQNVEYFGKTDAELAEFTDPIYKEAFLSCMQSDEKAWKAKGISINEEAIKTTKGITKIYDVIKVPIFETDGARKGLVVLGRDITEKKKIIEELIIAKEKAEESDRLKSAFLANMSHEIRTPMNGILGFAELLKEPKLTGEQQQEYLKIIEISGKRMLNIINDIVDISKIESNLMKTTSVETDINEKLEYIYTFFKPQAAEKGLQIFFKNALPQKKIIINTDKDKFYSIITNLIKNAIKFTDQGAIEFGYGIKEDYLEFYVKDTGIGIPKDRQEAIFKRFIQGDISDKMARQGAGLGLSISKAYVEMLGGKIWVESDEAKGTTFYFTLPYNTALQDAREITDGIANVKKEVQIKNLKILVVEDDDASKKFISITVKKLCKALLEASTGTEAVDICHNNTDIDLILMDIQIPVMNGYEATRQIRQFNKKVVIIAQTAFGLAGDQEKAIEAGCNDYIAKPINKDELIALIQKYFKK